MEPMPLKTLAALGFFLLVPGMAVGQEAPPPGLVQAEVERSRACVPGHALLAAVQDDLDPLARRSERLRGLLQAISFEDVSRAEPFDEGDRVEVAVREWFEVDARLAARYAEEQDESVLESRRQARAAIQRTLGEALAATAQDAQDLITSTEGVEEAVYRCDGRILVRPAVLEACQGVSSPVCEAARSEEPVGAFRFVDDAALLWDIERIRPWAAPERLQPTPEGAIGGARTEVSAQRGNLSLTLALETMLRPRSEISAEEAAEYDALLDRLDYAFGHPDFAMSPVMSFELELPAPLAGENGYILHFGEEPGAADDIVHTISARQEGAVSSVFVVTPTILERLQTGQQLWLTAVGITDPDAGDVQAEGLWGLELNAVRQSESVAELISYWAGGGLSDDLLALIPPREPGA